MQCDLIKQAIDALIQGEEWNRAKKIARDIEPRYEPYVDEKYKEFLKTQNQADAVCNVILYHSFICHSVYVQIKIYNMFPPFDFFVASISAASCQTSQLYLECLRRDKKTDLITHSF